ncbi:hypothetical protein HOLleu_04908 [Holothuria leucospilota]|uniref:YHYH domain-containing protein n=1 Tax=Holothuria leucospilota TaxID=206669 RepID=A0A9Q1HE67_HOLLE|nr:hypothetical protein HOLleu_04908 [Holothuria leucospilota]
MAVNGVIMYNPWDADGDNAVEGEGRERFDQCDGHPDKRGTYHYHKMPSSCLFEIEEGVSSPLIGVAFDGFAIYGPNDENGNRLTSADLDECHGRVNSNSVYQYHTTSDFPYILGCYKGTPVRRAMGNCYFASDADNEGDIVSSNTQVQSQGPTTRPNRKVGGRVEREERRQKREVSSHAVPMLPANLFKRRLPSGYKKWLSDIVFHRV